MNRQLKSNATPRPCQCPFGGPERGGLFLMREVSLYADRSGVQRGDDHDHRVIRLRYHRRQREP